jgi:hypothetical protein
VTPALGHMISFVAGILATFGWAFWHNRGRDRTAKSGRNWSEITRLAWRWSFDYTYDTPRTPSDIAKVIGYRIHEQFDHTPLRGVKSIAPGNYSIRINATADFVKRDP